MTLVVDTGVFSAAISRRRAPRFEPLVAKVLGRPVVLTPTTVAELRYGALLAGWGSLRHARLEAAIGRTTVAPVTDRLSTRVARLRFECRQAGHPLADPIHAADLWIAATAVHLDLELLTDDRVFEDAPRLRLA